MKATIATKQIEVKEFTLILSQDEMQILVDAAEEYSEAMNELASDDASNTDYAAEISELHLSLLQPLIAAKNDTHR